MWAAKLVEVWRRNWDWKSKWNRIVSEIRDCRVWGILNRWRRWGCDKMVGNDDVGVPKSENDRGTDQSWMIVGWNYSCIWFDIFFQSDKFPVAIRNTLLVIFEKGQLILVSKSIWWVCEISMKVYFIWEVRLLCV